MVSYPETSNARIKNRNKQLNKGDWNSWLVPSGGEEKIDVGHFRGFIA